MKHQTQSKTEKIKKNLNNKGQNRNGNGKSEINQDGSGSYYIIL